MKGFRYFVLRASGLELIFSMKLGIIHIDVSLKINKLDSPPPPLSQKNRPKIQKKSEVDRTPLTFLADITYERSFRYYKDIQSVKLAWSILHSELKAALCN